MTNKALDQEIAVNSATANKECSSPCSVGIQEEIMDPINFFQLSDLPEWPETYEHIEAMHKIWIASPEDDADAFSFSETANGRSYYFYGRKVFEFFPAKTKRSSPRFRLPTTIETKEGSVVEKYETISPANGCTIHQIMTDLKRTKENIFRNIITETFACCNSFIECSNTQTCIHENERFYNGCYYRKNLEQGRIFFGRNRNV